jgi:hypothetical protein
VPRVAFAKPARLGPSVGTIGPTKSDSRRKVVRCLLVSHENDANIMVESSSCGDLTVVDSFVYFCELVSCIGSTQIPNAGLSAHICLMLEG